MGKWFVKNEGQPELKDWVENQEDLNTDYLPVASYGFIVSDGYVDGTYQFWSDYADVLIDRGYTEITFEEFLKKI